MLHTGNAKAYQYTIIEIHRCDENQLLRLFLHESCYLEQITIKYDGLMDYILAIHSH